MLMRFSAAACSALALCAATQAQAAVDAQKVADAIQAFYAKNSIPLTIAGAEGSGENVILKGITYTPVVPDAKPFNIGDITLENVTETEKGFSAAQITLPANSFDDGKGIVVSFAGATVKNLSIPASGEANNPLGSMMLAESFEAGKASVAYNGTEVARMESAVAHYSPFVEGQPLTFDASFSGIHGDFSTLPDPAAQQGLADLGMTQVDGVVTMKGSWNMADGRFSVSEYALDFQNVGRLNIKMDISGYTLDFIKQMQEMSKAMAAKPDDAAQGMAMLGLAQQLTFNSFSVRFDDASVTTKIIDLVAKKAGQPREAVLAQAKGVVPFALMQLQDAEFSGAVTAAVTAFLDNPKSIEISATPAQGVAFSVLAATGMSQPAALIKQLALSVTANK